MWTQNFNFSMIDNVKFKLDPKFILSYNFFSKDLRFFLGGQIIIINRQLLENNRPWYWCLKFGPSQQLISYEMIKWPRMS